MATRSLRILTSAAMAVTLALTASACGGGGSGGSGGDGDKIVIGTKYDQPGFGLKNPDGTMSGFDVDVARYVAKELGYSDEQIEWKESPSGSARDPDRERSGALHRRDVLDHRQTQGEDLLRRAVPADRPKPAGARGQHRYHRCGVVENNKKLCSVTGSTPAQRIKDKYPGVQLQQYDTYSACVEALRNGAIDAVTTDEVILAGYAAQSPGALKIVGRAVLRGALRDRPEEGRHRTVHQDH